MFAGGIACECPQIGGEPYGQEWPLYNSSVIESREENTSIPKYFQYSSEESIGYYTEIITSAYPKSDIFKDITFTTHSKQRHEYTCTETDTDYYGLEWIHTGWGRYRADWTETINFQIKKLNCLYCEEKEFPEQPDNTKIAFTWKNIWNQPKTDKENLCHDINGTIHESQKQEAQIYCMREYRCLVPDNTCMPNEHISSYVSVKNQVFHEDIMIAGVDFGLHYQSRFLEGRHIAAGWNISVHHKLVVVGGNLYLGSGEYIALKHILLEDNNLTIVNGSSEYIFDINGTHLYTRDPYTKETELTFEYNTMGLLSTVTDRYGQVTTLNRNTNGTLTSIRAPHGQITYLKIDENDDLIEVQYEDTSSYTFEYQDHLMTKETEPNGNAFLHFFDESGKVVKVIDAEQGEWLFGSSSESTFGTHTVTRASGDVVTYKNHFLVNGMLKSEKTLPTGDVVLYENAVDDSSSATTTCGMKTTNIYKTQNGLLYKDPYTNKRVLESSTVTTPRGLSKVTLFHKSYRVDDNGTLKNIYSTTRLNGKLSKDKRDYERFRAWHVSSEGKKHTTTFGAKNTDVKTIKPYGVYKTTYTYDDQGRVTEESFGYRKTLYTYDSKGNLATITDPLGKTTAYSYGSRDRLVKTTYPDNNTLHYSYDSNGNMTILTTPTPTDHTFGYNGVNKRTSMTSPLGAATTYSYDKQRRVIKVTKPSSKSIDTNYVNGRVASVSTAEGVTHYSYSCQSYPSSISKGSESFNFTYDGTLITSMVQNGVLNHTTNYTYNNDFLPTAMTYAGVTSNYLYNKDNELVQSNDFNISRTLDYGIKQTLSDGTYTQLSDYNLYGELTEQSDGLLSVKLYRNKVGQITKKVETLNGTKVTYTYQYDDRARLITVRKNRSVVERYTYDANGNRATATVHGISITASYTLDDNLVVYGDNTYLYDDDGYLKTKTTPERSTTYVYGTLGELREVTTTTSTGSVTVVGYQHNANNQRVSKEVNGTTVEKYLWADLTTLLAIYDGADNLVQRFEYASSRMPVAMSMGADKYYLHYDQVGSLCAISNTSHSIVKEITYDTYGNIISDTNESLSVPFGFAGGLYDVDTKLTRFGYRDYDAYTGKWTAKDPIGFDGGDANLYGYVLGDPVNWIDVDGLKGASIGRRGGVIIIPIPSIDIDRHWRDFGYWWDGPHWWETDS